MSGIIAHADHLIIVTPLFSESAPFKKVSVHTTAQSWRFYFKFLQSEERSRKAAFSNFSGGVWTPAKGVFHSIKIPVQFLKIPLMNGTAFSGISGRGNNLARYTEIFEKILLGIFLPFWISGIFCWRVHFSEIRQIPDFLETFAGNFRANCPRFEIFIRSENYRDLE